MMCYVSKLDDNDEIISFLEHQGKYVLQNNNNNNKTYKLV